MRRAIRLVEDLPNRGLKSLVGVPLGRYFIAKERKVRGGLGVIKFFVRSDGKINFRVAMRRSGVAKVFRNVGGFCDLTSGRKGFERVLEIATSNYKRRGIVLF